MTIKYDLIIIGAGPAGLTAGLYAVRSGLKTAIISKDIGGTTNKILDLENWPGFKGSGGELIKKMYDQVRNYGMKFFMKNIEEIKKSKTGFIVKTKTDEFECKAIIITTGTERRKLNIPGEEKLTGKGVSYCTTCDAFFFKNKTIAVVGGSDCAAISALALTELAKKIYIFYRGKKLRCEKVNEEKLENKKNVEIIYDAIPKEILGEEKVVGLKVNIKGENKEFKLDGVFIEIGATPLTNFVKHLNLKLNNEGYIVVDADMNTNIKGIFAAGDVTNQKLKQVIVASSQGAIAAKSSYDYISKLKDSSQ